MSHVLRPHTGAEDAGIGERVRGGDRRQLFISFFEGGGGGGDILYTSYIKC